MFDPSWACAIFTSQRSLPLYYVVVGYILRIAGLEPWSMAVYQCSWEVAIVVGHDNGCRS